MPKVYPVLVRDQKLMSLRQPRINEVSDSYGTPSLEAEVILRRADAAKLCKLPTQPLKIVSSS